MGQSAEQGRERISEEAARWVVRLADADCPAAERSAFQRWRDADATHELAYERAAASWARLDRLQALRPGDAAPDPDLLAPALPEPANDRARWWKRTVAAAAGIALIGTTLTYGIRSDPAYATGIGERRVVMLQDGSRVELNTDSEIRVHFRDGRREVELLRGEATFDVVGEARPFVVRTADARFAAGRSALAVRIRPDGAAIAVERGAVEVAPEDAAPIRLAAGQQALVGDGTPAAPQPIDRDEISRRLAWRQGAISLNGQTLSEAVAEFNRYNSRQIAIADPAIADYRLGGYFRTGDIPGFVKALRTTFRISARATPDGRVELIRTPA